MKKFKLLPVLLVVALSLSLVACGSYSNDAYYGFYHKNGTIADDAAWEAEALWQEGETYLEIAESQFVKTAENNESYFSMDSNTEAYSNVRRMIRNNQSIYPNAVRTDEFLNYFSYSIPEPVDTFASRAEISVSPWNPETYLLTIGVKTKQTTIERYSQGNNLVFLIDVSGSMYGEDRIELVKKSFNMLIDSLNDKDTVSIVTYASGVNTVCSGVKANEKTKLKRYVNDLMANGATNGGDGIQRAYKIAENNFIKGGNNRIILATDGDFNVGISSPDELMEFIQNKAESGVYLTCLGYGMYNYRNDMLFTLAKHGNGNYAYIDTLSEAKKVLIDDADNALCVVASDVKSGITFDADIVDEYRIIGYENKIITKEEFNDERTDAGELGSNTTSMICYELKLKQIPTDKNVARLEIKYKDPFTKESAEYYDDLSGSFKADPSDTSEDFKFAAAIVEFSMILRNSSYKANSSLEHVAKVLSQLECCTTDEYKAEFKELVAMFSERG